MIDTELPLVEFTAHDRCDGCGAQAYHLATHSEHTELLLCMHHGKRSIDKLTDEGWVVTSDYEALSRLSPHMTVPV